MAHPGTNVTIVHGLNLPVSDEFPDYFREKVVTTLKEHDINIILNERADIDNIGENGVVRLTSGKTLSADLVVKPKYVYEYISDME